MTNLEKYNKAFLDVLDVTEAELGPNLVYQRLDAWDSVGHMSLIAELEEKFDIQLETIDVTRFSSYEKGKEVLARYGVTL